MTRRIFDRARAIDTADDAEQAYEGIADEASEKVLDGTAARDPRKCRFAR